MYADNFSGRQSFGPGRGGDDEAVADRSPLGLFDAARDGQVVPPPVRSTHQVGRVGALAVALGVGAAAMVGLAGAAAADTGADNSPGSAGEGAAHSGGAGVAKGKARAGNRGSSADSSQAASRRSATPGPRSGGLRSSDPDIQPSPIAPENISEDFDGGLSSLSAPMGDVESSAPSVVEAPGLALPPQIADLAVADEAPAMTEAAPYGALSDSDPLAWLGGGSGSGEPITAPLAWASLAVARREKLSGETPEVAPAAAVTTGEETAGEETAGEETDPEILPGDEADSPMVAASAMALDVGATQPYPPLPSCYSLVCGSMASFQGTVVNGIAGAIADALPAAGPAGGCNLSGCPAPISVANLIGSYAFNIVYSLMGKLSTATVAAQVQALANDTTVLGFISQTVSGSLSGVPSDVAETVGNAVAYFVQNTFGNSAVATAFVPFLQALNLPTTLVGVGLFAAAMEADPKAAILGRIQGTGVNQAPAMQTALINFFANTGVQSAFSAAVAGTVNVLIGATSPSWAPPVNPNAVADYAGELIATAVLGADDPGIPALGATLSTAFTNLFTAIGGDVGTQLGAAFVTLLNQTGVGNILATNMVNTVLTTLGGTAAFPTPGSLGPAVGATVTSFVTDLFGISAVPTALGDFVTQLIAGIANDSAVQAKIAEEVGTMVTSALGGGPIAEVVGPKVGAAVQALLANLAVVTAVSSIIGSLVPTFLNQQGVVSALASAAGQLATAALDGDMAEVLPEVIQGLRSNPNISDAVGVMAGTAVTQLLGDSDLWEAVDGAITTLVTELLGDSTVQEAVDTQLSSAVSELLGGGELGQVVGAQVAATIVGLMGNPVVSGALVALVDSVFGDFLGADGVVPALSSAVSQLASAAVAGDLDTVLPEVLSGLKTNPNIVAAVGVAVGGAVTQLLSDMDLWQAVDEAASGLITQLLGDSAVQSALNDRISSTVSALLGGGALGQVVGAQVADAVVGLLANPVVSSAFVDLFDTVMTDFFGYSGVVQAFSTAASSVALGVIGGQTFQEALNAALGVLKATPSVIAAVGVAVGGAVTQFLSDTALWAAVDGTLSGLITQLLGDSTVQSALNDRILNTVSELLGGGELGLVVGTQVADAVVALITDPVVTGALVDLVDSVLTDFFGSAGVVEAFSTAASSVALDLIGGESFSEALAAALSVLKANPDVVAAVGFSVGGAVSQFLSDTALWNTIDGSIAALFTQLLADPTVQTALNTKIATTVSELLGGGELGDVVGSQVANAVVGLISDPVFGGALVGLVDSVLTDFFGYTGVVSALSTAASDIALGLIGGETFDEAVGAALAGLKANPDVVDAVGFAVGGAVTQLLSDTALWTAIESATTGLLSQLLSDTTVQNALNARIASAVSAMLGGGALGDVVGAQVADAVVGLLTNPVVGSALVDLFDTVLTDFFGSTGVVAAFSAAASDFALAVMTGDSVEDALAAALGELKANPDVVGAVGFAVGGAVTQLLSDTALWEAIQGAATGLIGQLLSDSAVQTALNERIASTVSALLGGGELGDVVGAQVASTVVGLLTNPVVGSALADLFDTVLTDFFGSSGVVTAFSSAASDFALAVMTGDSVEDALAAALGALKANADVVAAVGVAVGGAVTQLLSDTALWEAIDGSVSGLITELLGDSTVQAALNERIAAVVSALLGGGALGDVVGAQVADTVVGLFVNPVVSGALVDLVDSLFGDFFGAQGVIAAVSTAASDIALAMIGGQSFDEALAAALGALKANADVVAAVGIAVGGAVTQLLSDTALWQAVDGAVAGLITQLLGDTTVQTALSNTISSLVSSALGGGELGDVVGAQVANMVVGLLTNPVVSGAIVSLVDSLSSDFFGAQGVVAAVATAASDVVLGMIGGESFEEAWDAALGVLKANPDVIAAVGISVGGAVTQLLSDTALWQAVEGSVAGLITDLLGDTTVQGALNARISSLVSTLLGGGALGAAVGGQVADAVVGLLADPVVTDALGAVVGTVLTDFFGAEGVISAVASAASGFALAVMTGESAETALQAAIEGLREAPDVIAAVGVAVNGAMTELLGDTALWDAFGTTAASLVSGLLGDSTVQAALDAGISSAVSALLGGGELGEVVGPQVASALMGVITSGAVVDGLEASVQSLVAGFFGAAGVIGDVSDAVSQYAMAVFSGEDPATALEALLASLKTAPAVIAGLETGISAALDVINTQLLSNPVVQQLLGSTVTTLVSEIAGDAVVQAAIANYLGAPYGAIIAGLLANTAFTDDLADMLGSAVVDFLSFPGFNNALISTANAVVEVILTGTPISVALQQGLALLQANPAFQAALDAIVPGLVDQILANDAVKQAIGAATEALVDSWLEGLGITNPFLNRVIGQVADVTIKSMMGRQATAKLLSNIMIQVLEGAPVGQVSNMVTQALLVDPELQVALGLSLGDGIGSLFGDNIFGYMIGAATGGAAAITISVVAGIIRIFDALFPRRSGVQAHNHGASRIAESGGYIYEDFGPYTASTLVPRGGGSEALRRGFTKDAGLAFTDFSVSTPTDSPDFVDVNVAINDANAEVGSGDSPLLVAFRFRRDWLFPAAGLTIPTGSAARAAAFAP